MTRKNFGWFIWTIVILVILLLASVVFVFANKNTLADNKQFPVDISFAGTMGTLVAVALSMAAIGYPIKEPDVIIYLGEKSSDTELRPIEVTNKGNVAGNIAMIFVQIEVPETCPITFVNPTGLEFTQTNSNNYKRYRFDDPDNPRNLFPGTQRLIGFLNMPRGEHHKIKILVQVTGTQGISKKKFTIKS